MRKCFYIFFCSLILALVTFPIGARSEQLTVMVLRNSPLMSFYNESGELVGFNVDVARLLCTLIGAECAIKETTLAEIIPEVSNGKADFGIASLTVTPERSKLVLFTSPYMRGKTVWISKRPINHSKKAKVAAVAGSVQYKWVFEQSTRRHWDAVSVPFNNDLVQILLAGNADSVVAPIATAMQIMQTKELLYAGYGITAIDAPEFSGPLSIAVTPSKVDLRNKLNAALGKIKTNGQLDRINSKYFPFRVF